MSGIIEVQGLKKYFKTPGGMLHAVDDVNMTFEQGTTVGVVGESGCGKSTLGRTIIHLHESTGGKIFFEGRDVTNVGKKELRELRENVQIIFQDPYSSLDPRATVEDTLKEPLILSRRYRKSEINERVAQLMDLVGIPLQHQFSYPHELDGGLRQRVGIGRALALNPKFVVCDEPVSALDVSIQAQILNLLMDLQKEFQLTYMFVSHDLSVVRHISDTISVMYLGQVVEVCESETLFNHPLHPYTKALLSAIPTANIHKQKEAIPITGEITSPIEPAEGCRFAARCPYASDACLKKQNLREVVSGHFVSCGRVEEINENLG